MAVNYLRIVTPARIDVSALVVPFTIEAADIQTEIDFDYPALEVSMQVLATAMPNVIPFRIAQVGRIDVSAPVVPLTLTVVPASLIDFDYPAMEFETGVIIYPDVDLIEIDFPSLEMGIETGEKSGRKAKLMIIQVL